MPSLPAACCDRSDDDSSDGRGESARTRNELPRALSLKRANASILIKAFHWHKAVKMAGSDGALRF